MRRSPSCWAPAGTKTKATSRVKKDGGSFLENIATPIGRCLNLAIRPAVVSGPLDQAFIEESPGFLLAIYLNQHIGVGIVTGGRDDIVLRSVGMSKVNP